MQPATFNSHLLHSTNRIWTQSNCSVDLWIELLNSWGENPVAALGFTVALDHEGDQFTFFKIPTADLNKLYGVQLYELSIYQSLIHQVVPQVNRGNVVLVEVDGYYLPDTAGVSYQLLHTKTTIGINKIDTLNQTCGYFHNDTYGTLHGNDYLHVMQCTKARDDILFPYTEFIKRSHDYVKDPTELLHIAKELFREHVAAVPQVNPIVAYRNLFMDQITNLQLEDFHAYAFNNFRMLGSNFEFLGDHLKWLDQDRYVVACESCKVMAEMARILQFKTARMVARKKYTMMTETFDLLEYNYNQILNNIQL